MEFSQVVYNINIIMLNEKWHPEMFFFNFCQLLSPSSGSGFDFY